VIVGLRVFWMHWLACSLSASVSPFSRPVEYLLDVFFFAKSLLSQDILKPAAGGIWYLLDYDILAFGVWFCF
jgi:hypothetical protein